MADPTRPNLNVLGIRKPPLDFLISGSRFQRMRDGSWEYSRNGSIPDPDRGTLRRYSLVDLPRREMIQAAATTPKYAPGHVPSTVGQSYDDEPSHNDENKPHVFEPPTLRTKPFDELKNIELAGPFGSAEMTQTSPNTMFNSDRTTRTSSVFSFSDDEDIYSAEDREPCRRSHDLIIAGTSFESFEIEHIENLVPQDSITTKLMLRNQERVVPRTDSDLESLRSVSDTESDIESWVNEPTIPELEVRLRRKTRWMKILCNTIQTAATEREAREVQHMKQLQEMSRSAGELSWKLQVADEQIQELRVKFDKELLAEKTQSTRAVLDGNNTLVASLERIHEKNLTSLKAGCDRRILAAEEMRLSELAEVEKKIRKCDEDWKAERKSLTEKLELKTKSEEECVKANEFLKGCIEAKANNVEMVARATEEANMQLSHQAEKARALLDAITDKSDGRGMEQYIKSPSNEEPQTLTLDEITMVVEETRTRLHKFWSTKGAEKELILIPEDPHSAVTNGCQRENVSDCTPCQSTSTDALVCQDTEAGPITVEVDAEKSTEANASQTQSNSRIHPSLCTPSSRLLKAMKCNRKLQKRLRSITENHEDVKKQNKVLLRDNTIVQEHVWKLVGNAANAPCYSRVPLEGDDGEVSVPLLKAQIHSLTQQAADITEERKAESEMHEKLRGHYFTLNAKYTGMLNQPNSLVEAQLRLAFLEKDRIPELTSHVIELEREIRSRDDLHREEKQKQESRYKGLTFESNRDKKELDMLHKIKVPALEGQVVGLQKRTMSIIAQHEGLSGLRNAVSKALVIKYEKLSKEHDQLRADHQRGADTQNDLELQNELQQQLTDLKLSMEDMTKVQKARYQVLDRQMSSFSLGNAKDAHPKYDSLLQTHKLLQSNYRNAEGIQRQLERSRDEIEIERNNLDREVKFLERRLEKSQRMADRAASQSAETHARERDLLNLNFKLKEANLKLARSTMSIKDIEEYPDGVAGTSWGHQERYITLRASYQKLEKAHEIAQEAHKVLESRLQEANLNTSARQLKLNETEELGAGSTILDSSRPCKMNLRPLVIAQAGRSASGLANVEFVDLSNNEPPQGETPFACRG